MIDTPTDEEQGVTDYLTLASLARVLVTARVEIAAAESTLNSLNVFPVPDGDTGTNMRVTLDAGLTALADTDAGDAQGAIGEVITAMTRGAAGNSGVILAEYLRGFVDVIERAAGRGGVRVDARVLADALSGGAAGARAAVDKPVEGTMLSVAEAAADAARHSEGRSEPRAPGDRLRVTAEAAFDAGRTALQRSPDQLDVLAEAGVVDAGGAGLLLVLECLVRVCSGRGGLPRPSSRSWLAARTGSPLRDEQACHVVAGGPAFEVMAVVEGLDESAAAALRDSLGRLGDSVVVAGGGAVHRAHVHTDTVLPVVSVLRAAGETSRLLITRFEGPIPELADLPALARDDAVTAYLAALGFADPAPEDVPVLSDAPGAPSGLSTVHLLACIDELVWAAGFGEDLSALLTDLTTTDPSSFAQGTGRELLQADSWRAAEGLVTAHLVKASGPVGAVTAVIDPRADPERVRAYVARLGAVIDEVAVLRLETGTLVQLEVIHG